MRRSDINKRSEIFKKFREQTGEFNIESYKDIFNQAIDIYSYKYSFNKTNLDKESDVIERYETYHNQIKKIIKEIENRFFKINIISPEQYARKKDNTNIILWMGEYLDFKSVLTMYEFEKRMRFLSLSVAKMGHLLLHLIEEDRFINFYPNAHLHGCTSSVSLSFENPEDIYYIDNSADRISPKYLNPYVSGQLVYFHYIVLKYYYFEHHHINEQKTIPMLLD